MLLSNRRSKQMKRSPQTEKAVTATGAYAALVTRLLTAYGARTPDEAKYPDLKGQWHPVAVPTGLSFLSLQYDPHKPAGRAQQAPLRLHQLNRRLPPSAKSAPNRPLREAVTSE
jgi:hypothetical protein